MCLLCGFTSFFGIYIVYMQTLWSRIPSLFLISLSVQQNLRRESRDWCKGFSS
eukprot:XP_001706538.1 Hypothetical protein GL50803_37494 [Giardia lamblia ATCC 50803]